MKSMEQSPNSLREAVIEYAARHYGSHAEHLWTSAPNYAVLRRWDNGKWYGLIMDISNDKLGLPGLGRTDILELKCAPERLPPEHAEPFICPAYHMKKGDWAAVRLDGSVPKDKVFELLDESYQLIAPQKVRPARETHPVYEGTQPGAFYADEPIRLSAEQENRMTPKPYRQMRHLALKTALGYSSAADIFYRQAKLMADFEDDCPYDQPVRHYYPTYQSLSMPELRGYFTWRTQLRRGHLEKTSLSYAFLYVYELLHQIGSLTAEEGLDKLIDFYERYRLLDSGIQRYVKRWIVDYAVYNNLPATRIRDYIDYDFDEALLTLQNCHDVEDTALFTALSQLSSYRLDKSKAFRQYPDELMHIICSGYRKLDARYRKRYEHPYTQKLYGSPHTIRYFPFLRAVFHTNKRIETYEYRVSDLQVYTCQQNQWHLHRGYLSAQRSQTLGTLIRTADRLVRESYQVGLPLKPGTETPTMIRFLSEAIAEQKRQAAPKVEFDLSKLSGIRRSADAVGQKLMTEEERYTEEAAPIEKTPSVQAPSKTILSGHELRFMQLLLYGGSVQDYLNQNHLMTSVLAETVNEHLFDKFEDTVIEFDGDTPVVVEDYLDDLK